MTKEEKIAAFDPDGPGIKNGNLIGLPFNEADAKIVLLPVPWDVTVSYADGTSNGPENIRDCSYQLDLMDHDVPDAWKMGIYYRSTNKDWQRKNKDLRPTAKLYIDFLENGGQVKDSPEMQNILLEINQACLDLKEWVYQETKAIMNAGKKVGLVGGEHSIPLGFLKALSEQHPGFGILQIDAHMDLREAYEGFTYSHASIFYNALKLNGLQSLTQVSVRDFCEAEMKILQEEKKVTCFFDHDIKSALFEGRTFQAICQKIIASLPQKVYISFDIDGLKPTFCMGTGTPVPGGLSFEEAMYLLKMVVDSGREIIGFDLSEVAGGDHEFDGNVGARVLYKLSNLMGYSKR